ncbi:hypothetical protein BASA81_006910 [Batrachochytrium salamandrivorans]|nr:hypothetical protein BASA81_006910 [Batrachochytrium salamandrivorans]
MWVLFVLVACCGVLAAWGKGSGCPPAALGTAHMLLGGFSPARAPTKDEISKLKSLWESEAQAKCSGGVGATKFAQLEVCSVRVQVVNGVNIDYLLASPEEEEGTIHVLAHFPGSWSVGQSPKLVSCQVNH